MTILFSFTHVEHMWDMASISTCKLFVEKCLFLHLQVLDNDTTATIV